MHTENGNDIGMQAQGASPNPGDEAAEGTPGSGEDICRKCHGKGTLGSGMECPDCGGTGRIIEGIGGG